MKAYHNDPALKARCLEIMAAHREAETLVQGHGYWKDGHGCAVGCLLHELGATPDDHSEYEDLIGVPRMMGRLKDTIYENLPPDTAQPWPERFLSAIPVGADLSRVQWQFLDWLLASLPDTRRADVTAAVRQVRETLLQPLARGETVSAEVVVYAVAAAEAADAADAVLAAQCRSRLGHRRIWHAAYVAAVDAAKAAASAADAADAAAVKAAETAVYAASAADAAAKAAAYAAYAVSTADAAVDAAASAADAAYAARQRQADELIRLLEAVDSI